MTYVLTHLNPSACEYHMGEVTNMNLYRVTFRPPNDRSYIQMRCAGCIVLMYDADWNPCIVEWLHR